MSLCLADVDELSTDSDDEEYIPEGLDIDSDPAVCEDGKSAAPGRTTIAKSSRRPTTRTHSRKRKGKLEEKEAGLGNGEGEEGGSKDQEEKKVKEKTRIDQLWASFKQDTTFSKPPPQNKGKGVHVMDEPTPPKKLKIQKKYDFAGEEIVVEKEVATDSKEAMQYLQSCAESEQAVEASSILAPEDVGTRSSGTPTSQPSTGILQARGTSAKRGSGLGAVLQSIGKKAKMSTLEKTSIDWHQYKQEHQLEEELAHNTKDGYLARQEFLQWSDQKQFELERKERLKRFTKLH